MLIDNFILYSLSVYWFYHLVSRSDIMERPRNWAFRVFPDTVVYPLNCSYCMTFWIGVLGGLPFMYNLVGLAAVPICLFAAPTFNLVLDLGVKALIKVNEESKTVTTSTYVTRTYGDSNG